MPKKKSNKSAHQATTPIKYIQSDNKPKKSRALIIFVAVFLALALIFGAVLLIITGVRRANSVVIYEGIRMDKEVASFFVSRYKSDYISEMKVLAEQGELGSLRKWDIDDTAEFWSRKTNSGITYGEDFAIHAKEYLKEIIAGAYIFDKYSELTEADKARIEKAVNDVISYTFDGNTDKFNEVAARYGFDYDSLMEAATLLYKSSSAFIAKYGDGGAAISSDTLICDEYLSTYTHVSLIIIRTETTLEKDDAGNYEARKLTESEREVNIETIETLMRAIDGQSNIKMTPTMFEEYLTKSDAIEDVLADSMLTTYGYYFNENATLTKSFDSDIPNIVEKAYGMKLGEFGWVETTLDVVLDGENKQEKAYAFIYKYAPDKLPGDKKAYQVSELIAEGAWLSDFFTDVAGYDFVKSKKEIMSLVEYGGAIDEMDFVAIPKNSEQIIPKW